MKKTPATLTGKNKENESSLLSSFRWLCIGCLLLGASCQKEVSSESRSVLPSNAVAQVGDSTISLEQYQAALHQHSRRHPDSLASPEEKRMLLDGLVRTEMLYQRAKAEGYETNAEIVATLKRMIIRKFQDDQLVNQPAPTVTTAEIDAYYHGHLDEFRIPEQRLGAVIFKRVPATASDQKIMELQRSMKGVRQEAIRDQKQGPVPNGFGILAQKHSEDQATRYRGGMMGWLSSGKPAGGGEASVAQGLFALEKPGDISPVIATIEGLYLIKAMEIRPSAVKSIEEVRDGIAYRLGREKKQKAQEAFYATQKAQVSIELNAALLETVASPMPRSAARPPGIPGT